jgi:hypothetical protein
MEFGRNEDLARVNLTQNPTISQIQFLTFSLKTKGENVSRISKPLNFEFFRK